MPTAGFALNFSISQILICINTGLMRQILVSLLPL